MSPCVCGHLAGAHHLGQGYCRALDNSSTGVCSCPRYNSTAPIKSPPSPEPERDDYAALKAVLVAALEQAASGKGKLRHALHGEPFEQQQIVRLGEWMESNHFEIGQACKKALESTRFEPTKAKAELLGAINYLAAAVIVLERMGERLERMGQR